MAKHRRILKHDVVKISHGWFVVLNPQEYHNHTFMIRGYDADKPFAPDIYFLESEILEVCNEL